MPWEDQNDQNTSFTETYATAAYQKETYLKLRILRSIIPGKNRVNSLMYNNEEDRYFNPAQLKLVRTEETAWSQYALDASPSNWLKCLWIFIVSKQSIYVQIFQ